MDVNEVKAVTNHRVVQEKTSQSDNHEASKPTETAPPSAGQDVKIDVHTRKATEGNLIAGLNQAIATSNVVSKTVEEIEDYFRGITGIIEQAASGNVPENGIPLLEQEANDLIEEIRAKVQTRAPSGVRPLAGESFGAAWEETLGKTLDIMLPDVGKDNFGLEKVRLSTSDFIVGTRAAVARSLERLQFLKESVEGAGETIRKTALEVDVARQNAEASKATLREVEFALSFAGKMGEAINAHPLEALDSLGELNPEAVAKLWQE